MGLPSLISTANTTPTRTLAKADVKEGLELVLS
jgi:hypothetical protein